MGYNLTKEEKVDAAKRYYQSKMMELEVDGTGKLYRRLKRLEMYRMLIEKQVN